MNFIRTKKRVLAGTLAALFTVPVFASHQKLINDHTSEKQINSMDADPFYKKALEEELPSIFKIYNSKDELVYECSRLNSDAPDIKLIRLLNKSDFLTSNDKTSYFRLNE